MVPVSWGELIDKITILEIKQARLEDAGRRANVTRELLELSAVRDRVSLPALTACAMELRDINGLLWEIEDAIRECERRQDFGARFIQLAREVYHTNDRRAEIKREINRLLGSALVEEKSYQSYQASPSLQRQPC